MKGGQKAKRKKNVFLKSSECEARWGGVRKMLHSHDKEGLPLGPSWGFTWHFKLRGSEAKEAQCERASWTHSLEGKAAR